MNCCCIPEDTPKATTSTSANTFNHPLAARTSQHKAKFSFRSSQASSHSELSQSVLTHDREVVQLERQYQLLQQEQLTTEEYERNRIKQLQDEVAFYERELGQRDREIHQLNHLFRSKMQERAQGFIPVGPGAATQVVRMNQVRPMP